MKAAALSVLALVAFAGVATSASELRIEANTLKGYTPPVASLASGDSVVFVSTDTIHVTSDGGLPGESDPCFFVAHSPGNDSPPVTFTVDGGALLADGAECANARTLPGGAFALPYFCILHPTMHGVLVVG